MGSVINYKSSMLKPNWYRSGIILKLHWIIMIILDLGILIEAVWEVDHLNGLS